MTVASVTEISAASPDGFEAAIREGIERATKTLRNVQSAWVKDMNILMEDGQIRAYKEN
jgi:flavin-binding protein dodecin